MSNIEDIRNKQKEKLEGKSPREKALAAAKRAAEEMRSTGHIKEPDQLASGKSDENGSMVWDDDPSDGGD